MISLEAMHHDKQMDSHKIRRQLLWTLIELLQDLLLTELLCVLDHLNKVVVIIDAVALLENDGTHFNILLLHRTQGSNPQLRRCVK